MDQQQPANAPLDRVSARQEPNVASTEGVAEDEVRAWLIEAADGAARDVGFGWSCRIGAPPITDLADALQHGVVFGTSVVVPCEQAHANDTEHTTCALRYLQIVAHAQLGADQTEAGVALVRTYLQQVMEAHGFPSSANAYLALAAMLHNPSPRREKDT